MIELTPEDRTAAENSARMSTFVNTRTFLDCPAKQRSQILRALYADEGFEKQTPELQRMILESEAKAKGAAYDPEQPRDENGQWTDTGDSKAPIIQKAIETATIRHKDQLRKGGKTPYIEHPLAVSKMLKNYTNDPDVIAAGALHDTMEDADYTYEEIKKDFNKKVADIVRDVSEQKDQDRSKGARGSWDERKTKYI